MKYSIVAIAAATSLFSITACDSLKKGASDTVDAAEDKLSQETERRAFQAIKRIQFNAQYFK